MNRTLPYGWQWIEVGDAGRVVTGTTPKKAQKDNYGDYLPFFRPTELDAGYFVSEARDHLSEKGASLSRVLPTGAVLVTCIGATIGKTGLARVPCSTNQQINALVVDPSLAIPEWFFYAFSSQWGQDQIKNNASATTLPILNKGRFKKLQFPLPPLETQRRIVAKLDALLARSRKAKASLAAIPPLLERFRQSVLAAAFRGDLTAEWRAQNPDVEPASVLLERIRAERKVRVIKANAQKALDRAKARTLKKGKPWTEALALKTLEKERTKAAKKYKAPEPVDTTGLPELPEGWCWAGFGEAFEVFVGATPKEKQSNTGVV